MSPITLTTDFGTNDWFVGTLHGVILCIEPRARIVDITHAIPPGDVRAGAFALRSAAPWFPKGTIHVAVVDPGVGGPRPALAIRTSTAWFVGPDNGVFSWAIAGQKVRSIRRLENRDLFLPEVSQTFHGRDVFAPVAARLAGGIREAVLGPQTKRLEQLTWPKPRIRRDGILGEVLYIDRFGNAITNIDTAMLHGDSAGTLQGVGRRWRCPLATHYGAVAPGRPVAVASSTGFLEIAVNGRSAASQMKLSVGDPVRFIPGDGRPGHG